MDEFAAIVACVVLVALALFQVSLVMGAPIGHFAWGGKYRVLPTNLRIGSVISIVLYALFTAIILQASELVSFSQIREWSTVGIWVLTGYFVIGIGMNAISRSKPERMVMTPVAAILATMCLLIAL